jgi:hypothetical protein
MTVTYVTSQIITSGLLSKRQMEKVGARAIISLTNRRSRRSTSADEIVFPLNENWENPPERIIEILQVIDTELRFGRAPVLIHCDHGEDRSPTIAALYLYYSDRFNDFFDAVDFVKSRNKKIKLKKRFLSSVADRVLPLLATHYGKRGNNHCKGTVRYRGRG